MWESFIEAVTKVNDWVNGVVWGWPMIIMILGTGILLTVRTRVLQVRKFGESMSTTIVPAVKDMGKKKNKNDKNAVSQFEAFSAAISGTVGTGNIIGVTSAILTGGPGAVLWMWISAFFGMVTNYSENVLGLYYRKKEKDGSFSGGAFYYIANGLKQRRLGMLAAIFCLLAAVGMSGVQTNKITGSYTSVLGNDSAAVKLIIGGIVAFFAAVVIIGGIKRIGRIASMLVPFMSLLFIAMAFVIIGKNYTAVPETFHLIFTSAFSSKAVAGGVSWFGHDDCIARVETRHESEEHGLRAARRDDDVVGRHVDVVLRIVAHELLPVRQIALRRRVLEYLPVYMLERVEAHLRRGQVGLSYVQVVDLHPALLGIGSERRQFANRRLRHLKSSYRDFWHFLFLFVIGMQS